jgi:fructoselysine 6-kinase
VKLLGLGDSVVDCYIHTNTMYPGGNALNVAVFARRFGLEAAYLGYVGTDRAGDHILDTLRREMVDVSRVIRLQGPTWHAWVKLEQGDRVFMGSDRGVYRQFALSEEDFTYINQFDVIHTSVFSQIEPYLPRLAEAPGLLSFDYSNRVEQAYIEQTARYLDVALFSHDGISGDDLEGFMRSVAELGPEVVIVTMGEQGSVALHDGRFFRQSAFLCEAVDTMGAGDSFIAMFLVCYAQGMSIPECLQRAARASAQNCLVHGAFGYGIAMEEVDRG